jgi:hypothetical protein
MPNFKADIYPDNNYLGAVVHVQPAGDWWGGALIGYESLYPSLLMSYNAMSIQ